MALQPRPMQAQWSSSLADWSPYIDDHVVLLTCRSRAIAFKAIADGLPSDAALQARLVRAPYPVTLMHELQLHAWNDVKADGRQYVVDLMDDAGALYEKVGCADGGHHTAQLLARRERESRGSCREWVL